jgi:hypothetical protein
MDQQACGIPAELWEEYGVLQSKANRAKLDSYTWAIDDQLEQFLDSIKGRLPEDSEARSKLLHNLVLNRTKKHNRRCRMLEAYCASAPSLDPEREAIDRLYLEKTVGRLRSLVADREWRILCRLANGKGYEAVAAAERLNPSTLKSQVSRCRARLRQLVA